MSEINFPLKDLTRRKRQTTLTVLGLTLATAATIFLVLFGSNMGFDIAFIIKRGQITSGFYNIFSQFILIVTTLNIITGPIITSFLVQTAMSSKIRDIGIMKASGCITESVFAYFLTELSLLILLSSAAGIILGTTAYYIATIILNTLGFYISQNINIWTIIAVTLVTIIASHIFGAKPLRKASQTNPTQAMSPLFSQGTTTYLGKKLPSKLGFNFKIAIRNLLRRTTSTTQAIICLTIVLTLTTLALTGGLICNQTTQTYTENAIGRNIIIVGHKTITDRYVSLLSQFFEKKETNKLDYLNPETQIPDTLITELGTITGIEQIDPRLIFEHSVREVPGIILDSVEQIEPVIVGDSRTAEALILGVQPDKLVNDWLLFGKKLESNNKLAAIIGDSLSVNMFSVALNQSIKIDEDTLPYEIQGICVDPLNNGKVVYVPQETLHNISPYKGQNLVLLQVNQSINQQVVSQIEKIANTQNLTIVKLDSILDKHVNFLDKIWSLIILLPLFSLTAGALSLMGYLITSISEQQKQFGIMRALGTKPKSILKIVFYQASLILTVSGTLEYQLDYILR